MKPPYEDLSRLLDGDLPPDEAAALRARIRDEPEVAAAWASLQRLAADLAALPEEAPPAPAPRRRPRWPLAAAAALAILGFWAWPAPPGVVLTDGTRRIEAAAATPVEIDGVATVDLRTGEVTVHAGRAAVGDVALDAPRAAPPSDAAERVAWLESENRRLQDELDRERIASAVARGRVSEAQGTPRPWPASVPAGFAPAEFEATVRAAAAEAGLELHDVDCAEFPCIATFVLADGPLEPRDQMQALTDALGDEHNVWVGVSSRESPDASGSAAAVSFSPPGADGALTRRTSFRADALLEALAVAP